ncbi:MAG: hypothetical protein KJ760_15715, partial [Proteobacteria bacterium]|nr:hypothetical protein [Pseudomonadota bacterium]
KYIEIFGGDSVYVPKAESVIRMGRDRKIYREFKEKNVSIDELAARYGLTPRHIRVILQDQKRLNRQVNEKQLEMF